MKAVVRIISNLTDLYFYTAKKKADALDDGPGSNTKKARISKLTGESSRATRSRSSK